MLTDDALRRRGSFITAHDPAQRGLTAALLTWLVRAPTWARFLLALPVTGACLAVVAAETYVEQAERHVYHADLLIYCGLYSAWFVCCLPDLLARLNLTLLLQVARLLLKLFFAEVAVVLYSWHRGYLNVLRPGTGMLPALEANRPGVGLGWLGIAGYNLRLATLLACVIVSLGYRAAQERRRRQAAGQAPPPPPPAVPTPLPGDPPPGGVGSVGRDQADPRFAPGPDPDAVPQVEPGFAAPDFYESPRTDPAFAFRDWNAPPQMGASFPPPNTPAEEVYDEEEEERGPAFPAQDLGPEEEEEAREEEHHGQTGLGPAVLGEQMNPESERAVLVEQEAAD